MSEPKRKSKIADVAAGVSINDADNDLTKICQEILLSAIQMEARMRVLCITTNGGNVFYSAEFSAPLVVALERQCIKRHGGVKQMTLVEMTSEEYQAIPATNQSADLFSVDY